jgi:hypothetical protein
MVFKVRPMEKAHKYKAKPVTIDGIRFPSKKEAARWFQLVLLQRAGEISGLARQVPILLHGELGPIKTPTGRNAVYKADFTYTDAKTGSKVIEDAKGYQTPEYKLKRAILAAQGIEIREV